MASRSALVLLTGGSDSATLLAWAVEGYTCRALYFRKFEQENRELDSAKAAAEAAKVKLDVIDFPQPVAALLEGGTPIPFTYTLGLSMAVSHAASLGIDTVMLGINADDLGSHHVPELTCDFIEKFDEIAKMSHKTMRILIPFIQKSKHEVYELGKKLGVDYSKTWSCNNVQGTKHCGKCSSCTDRRKAFKLSGIQDQTPYIPEDEYQIPADEICFAICVVL